MVDRLPCSFSGVLPTASHGQNIWVASSMPFPISHACHMHCHPNRDRGDSLAFTSGHAHRGNPFATVPFLGRVEMSLCMRSDERTTYGAGNRSVIFRRLGIKTG
jgi:hypothetical protein